MESIVILYQKTLFTISFLSLWPLFCFMYKFLFSRYQSTEEGNGAVNSLGTSCVAVSVQHHCFLLPSQEGTIGSSGDGHCLESPWGVCVVFPARVTVCSPCFSGWCQGQQKCSGKWGGTENPHSSLQKWLLIFCQVKASEVACSVPVSIVDLRKIAVSFCSSRAVGTPSCWNTHILKNCVFSLNAAGWYFKTAVLGEGVLPWSLECDFRPLRYLRKFVFLTTEVLPKFSGFLNSAQFGCWWAKEW